MSGISDPRLTEYWQYKVKSYHRKFFSGSKAIETEQELNEIGSERFELISVVPDGEFYIYTFKRLMIRF